MIVDSACTSTFRIRHSRSLSAYDATDRKSARIWYLVQTSNDLDIDFIPKIKNQPSSPSSARKTYAKARWCAMGYPVSRSPSGAPAFPARRSCLICPRLRLFRVQPEPVTLSIVPAANRARTASLPRFLPSRLLESSVCYGPIMARGMKSAPEAEAKCPRPLGEP